MSPGVPEKRYCFSMVDPLSDIYSSDSCMLLGLYMPALPVPGRTAMRTSVSASVGSQHRLMWRSIVGGLALWTPHHESMPRYDALLVV